MLSSVLKFAGITIDQWGGLAALILSVGTIVYSVKKIIIKWVASELKTLRAEVTPNGKDTQRTGDIVARTEQKIDNLYAFMERYAAKVDKLEKEIAFLEGLIEGKKE